MLGIEYGLQSVSHLIGGDSHCSQLKDFGQDNGKIKGAEWASAQTRL